MTKSLPPSSPPAQLHHLAAELSGGSNQASDITPREERVSDDTEMDMNIDPYLLGLTGRNSTAPVNTTSTPATSGGESTLKPSSDTASSATLGLNRELAGSVDDDVEMSGGDGNLTSQGEGTSKARADNEGANAAKRLIEQLGIDQFTDDVSSGTKWGLTTSTKKAANKSGTNAKRGRNVASNRSLKSQG